MLSKKIFGKICYNTHVQSAPTYTCSDAESVEQLERFSVSDGGSSQSDEPSHLLDFTEHPVAVPKLEPPEVGFSQIPRIVHMNQEVKIGREADP